MPKTDRTFQPIQDPYMHGVEAEHNFRHVEVVRAYAGDWRIFAKIKGYTCKQCPEIKDTYPSKGAALKDARAFLCGDFTPDTWKTGEVGRMAQREES